MEVTNIEAQSTAPKLKILDLGQVAAPADNVRDRKWYRFTLQLSGFHTQTRSFYRQGP